VEEKKGKSSKALVDRVPARGKNEGAASLAERIVSTVVAPLLILDQTLQVKLANPAFYKTFQVNEAETLGRNVADLGNGQWNVPRLRRLLDDITANKSVVEGYDVEHEFPGIGYRIMLLNARRLDRPGKEPPLILVAIEDATERRRTEKRASERANEMEARVRHAQKLESLGVLAGGIAHDFNNLLVSVVGNAELAAQELPRESGARVYIQAIMQAAQRAAELTHQMLAYSGKGRIEVTQLDLNRLIQEMSHLLEVSISKKVVLKYHLANNLPLIEGDATQIRQVIMNLIINAAEATGERSGVVTVSTGVMEADRAYLGQTFIVEDLPEGYYCHFEVADTGCGMGAESMERIFDPLFNTKFAGRGRGLAAVLGIVRGHKGALKVYSQLNRGTTFKVLLPCAQQAAEDSGEKKQKPDVWRGRGTVLVADDEETVVTVTKQLLEKRGLSVLVARDGKQAVKLFEQRAREIDVVLLDLTMPHMSGEEAFRELRRIDPDVRVILTSGYSEEDTMTRFAGKGVVDFVQKPYRPGSLIAAVRGALESKPKEARPRRGKKK